MKKICSSLIVGACALALSLGTSSAAGRQVNQQERIAQGVLSGELTRPEARHLERNAVRLHRSIQRDRRDGGEFTARERVKAEKKLKRQSRAIYRQKHDNQDRD